MKKIIIISAIILSLTTGIALTKAMVLDSNSTNNPKQVMNEYKNATFGYSLDYPKDWILYETDSSPVGHIKIKSGDFVVNNDKHISGNFVEVYVHTKVGEGNLRSWLTVKDKQNSDVAVLSEEVVKINGYEGIKRIVPTLGDKSSPSFDLFFEKNGDVYEIAGLENAEKLEQINSMIDSFQIAN
jgi:hypothetical protein